MYNLSEEIFMNRRIDRGFENFARRYLKESAGSNNKAAKEEFAQERGWYPGSIEPLKQPKGGRNLADYERVLGFERKDLEGETILDLGTGPEGKLAQELLQAKVEAQVVSLSPDLVFGKYRGAFKKPVQAIAGLGQNLPFQHESFDRVLLLFVLEHLQSDDDFFSLIEETARILKKGGQAHIGPTLPVLRNELIVDLHYQAICENPYLMELLEGQKVVVSHESVPGEEFYFRSDNLSGYNLYFYPRQRLVLKKSVL